MSTKRTWLFIIGLFLPYHLILIHAANETDQHSNQTIAERTEVLTTLSSNVTEEIDGTNATIVEQEPSTFTVTEEVFTTVGTFNETTSLPAVSSTDTEVTTPPTSLNVSTVVGTTEKEVAAVNITQEYVPTTTEYNDENQTVEMVNGSCGSSKFGCCTDGVTKRTGMF